MAERLIKKPCLNTIEIPIDSIDPNEYNPNHVDKKNMKLLELSIIEDGQTMPIVVIQNKETGRYAIIDGFHRWTTMKKLKQSTIAAVVLEKGINERMAATVRHNRARGVHMIELMSDMVVSLIQNGMADSDIAKHLGMDADEVLRLKQTSNIAGIFENLEYSDSWEFKEV